MATFKNIITFPLKETLASDERILSTHGAKSLWMMGQNLWWNSNFALSDFATCLGRTNRSHLKKRVIFLHSYVSSNSCSIFLLEATLNQSWTNSWTWEFCIWFYGFIIRTSVTLLGWTWNDVLSGGLQLLAIFDEDRANLRKRLLAPLPLLFWGIGMCSICKLRYKLSWMALAVWKFSFQYL